MREIFMRENACSCVKVHAALMGGEPEANTIPAEHLICEKTMASKTRENPDAKKCHVPERDN